MRTFTIEYDDKRPLAAHLRRHYTLLLYELVKGMTDPRYHWPCVDRNGRYRDRVFLPESFSLLQKPPLMHIPLTAETRINTKGIVEWRTE